MEEDDDIIANNEETIDFMNEYYLVFGIRKSLWTNTIRYSVFVKFHEQILFGIQYLEIFHERILFGIWYSENFHEQILFSIRYS